RAGVDERSSTPARTSICIVYQTQYVNKLFHHVLISNILLVQTWEEAYNSRSGVPLAPKWSALWPFVAFSSESTGMPRPASIG
ncbi:MAG: hypothetical protein KJS68_14770, partial [Alphaproteobacteria bacterium]|nr:hypothetical protein [Alphaproteobacteria bacterium]